MAGEDGNGGGKGAEGASGGGAPNGAESGDNGGDAGGTPTGINPEVLPEFLRGKSENEVKFYLNQAFTSLETQQDQIRRLRQDLESRPTESAPPPPPDPDDDKPLEELILEDTDKAIEKWMKRKGYVDRFSSVEGRVGDMAFKMVEDEFPDIGKYKKEIRETLKSSGAPVTENTIRGVYKMLKGEEYLEEQQKAHREQMSSQRPTPPKGDEGKPKPGISDTEKIFAAAQGMTEEEFIKFRDEEFTINTPKG